MEPLGIHGAIGSFVQFMKDIPEECVLQVNLTCATDAIITLQSSYMREVLLEASSGLQSDTVEGVIHDPKYCGNVDTHFNPVMIVILSSKMGSCIDFIGFW